MACTEDDSGAGAQTELGFVEVMFGHGLALLFAVPEFEPGPQGQCGLEDRKWTEDGSGPGPLAGSWADLRPEPES